MKNSEERIQIPSLMSWVRFGIFVLSIVIAAIGVFGIITLWKILGISIKGSNQLESLTILPSLIFQYILFSLIPLSFCVWYKKGIKNLKRFDEEGLIWWLIAGLIVGLIFGLIFGSIVGLIFGLIWGLIVGLIAGMFFGLMEEFES